MTDVGATVLMVEDEPQVRRFLRVALGTAGYIVHEAATLAAAQVAVRDGAPAVILLDLGLPDGDGIAWTRQFRTHAATPIIVISARGREEDKVNALDAGANDYLTKPFGVRELLARIRVVLRQSSGPSVDVEPDVLRFDRLEIDVAKHRIVVADAEVHLTPIEYKLLVLLARNAGRVLTHRQILKDVWGNAHGTESHHVRVHLAELRKKIESNPAQPRLIITEPGVGYRMKEPLKL
ncbi:MAG TPA: response regulator [Kofleriaceae bacterium]|nr:response regulator [Kofleriaceae bacterium]